MFRVRHVVLDVTGAKACRRFRVGCVGMVAKQHAHPLGRGVDAMDIGGPSGARSVELSGPEGRWFAFTS